MKNQNKVSLLNDGTCIVQQVADNKNDQVRFLKIN